MNEVEENPIDTSLATEEEERPEDVVMHMLTVVYEYKTVRELDAARNGFINEMRGKQERSNITAVDARDLLARSTLLEVYCVSLAETINKAKGALVSQETVMRDAITRPAEEKVN